MCSYIKVADRWLFLSNEQLAVEHFGAVQLVLILVLLFVGEPWIQFRFSQLLILGLIDLVARELIAIVEN